MKKTSIITFMTILTSFYGCKSSVNNQDVLGTPSAIENDTVPEKNESTVTVNDGISYIIPSTWKQIDKNETTNLQGEVTNVETNYTSEDDNFTVDITHYIGEAGKEIYEYKTQEKEYKTITQNGVDLAMHSETLERDGKGNKLPKPESRITVEVLSENGAVEFVFNTQEEKHIEEFNNFLETIRHN